MIVQQKKYWNLNISLKTYFHFIFNWSVYPLISSTKSGPRPELDQELHGKEPSKIFKWTHKYFDQNWSLMKILTKTCDTRNLSSTRSTRVHRALAAEMCWEKLQGQKQISDNTATLVDFGL